VSVTTAFSVVDVPEFTSKEVVPGLPKALIVMDCTGQVVKDNGWLFTLPTLAKMEVWPGLLATAIS
jgi:hypothetical protein